MAAEGGRIDFMFLGPSYLAAGSATGRSGNFGQITDWGHHLADPGPATYDERLISARHQYVDGQALSCVNLTLAGMTLIITARNAVREGNVSTSVCLFRGVPVDLFKLVHFGTPPHLGPVQIYSL